MSQEGTDDEHFEEVPSPEPEDEDPALATEPGIPAWVTELLAKLGRGEDVDPLRLQAALQLQAQGVAAAAEARQIRRDREREARDAQREKEQDRRFAALEAQVLAQKTELQAAQKLREQELEPDFREFAPRVPGNPFGYRLGPEERLGDKAEPQIREYTGEKVYDYLEAKGADGRQKLHCYAALASAAEACWDGLKLIETRFPQVIKALNPDGLVDDGRPEYEAELDLCRAYNTFKAVYENTLNPQISYMQMEAILNKRHPSGGAFINQIMAAVSKSVHGLVGVQLPANLSSQLQAAFADLEEKFSKDLIKQAAATAARTENRSMFRRNTSGGDPIGSSYRSRQAAQTAARQGGRPPARASG
jgi:hypothetical protein